MPRPAPQARRASPALLAGVGAVLIVLGTAGIWWRIRGDVQVETAGPAVFAPVSTVAANGELPPGGAAPGPGAEPAPDAEPGAVEAVPDPPADADAAAAPVTEQAASPLAPAAAPTEPAAAAPTEAAPTGPAGVAPSVPVTAAGAEAAGIVPPSEPARANRRADSIPEAEASIPRPGILHLTTTQPARIYVDGKSKGNVDRDLRLELPPGNHTVRAVSRDRKSTRLNSSHT